MSRPEERELRQARRIEAAFRVRYRSLDQLVVALTHDFSRGGLFMRTPRLLPVNAIVRVLIELPDAGGEVPLVCRVAFARSEAEASASGKPAGMGVEFLDLDGERMAQLTRFVTDRQLEPAAAAGPRRPAHVLVVDDDASLREPVARALRERGDRVRETRDGLDALAACLKEVPDVVVSDLQMPRMDGWQLVRMLRARPSLSRVPVILITTLVDDEARLRGYRMGVDDYIGKPVAVEELMVRIDRVVSRSRQPARERHALRGDLEQVTLASLLSFLAMEQKTGALFLVGEGTARIFMRNGAPVRAELDDHPILGAGDPALVRLLDWRTGQFEFSDQDVAGDDELQTSVNALLLEHARRTDEEGK